MNFILAYVKTGDTVDKATAYGTQTQGVLFVKEIKWGYSVTRRSVCR